MAHNACYSEESDMRGSTVVCIIIRFCSFILVGTPRPWAKGLLFEEAPAPVKP